MNIKDFIEIANNNRYLFQEFKANIFPATLVWEGGSKLHKVKGDSGGWTKFGIAYNKNRKYFKDLPDFKDTTYDEAVAFAFVMYYLPLRPTHIPKNCRLYMFDMAFNMGTHRAVTYMQKCIGVPSDGVIGAITIRNMNKLKEECLHKRRVAYYQRLRDTKRWARKFYKGWLNRANNIFRK